MSGDGLSRAYSLGLDARTRTIAAWLRTLVDWNISLERAAEMIEAGVPWSDSEQPLRENLTEAEFCVRLPVGGNKLHMDGLSDVRCAVCGKEHTGGCGLYPTFISEQDMLAHLYASVDTLPQGEDREDGLRAEQG